MCALESSGGGGTTTAGGSSSAGTSEVKGLTVQGTAPSDAEFVQEGSGTVIVSSTSFNSVRVAAGTVFRPSSTVIIFQVVGAITRPNIENLSVLDGFADDTIDPVWVQTAANGSIAESNDLLTLSFGTGANAILDGTAYNQTEVDLSPPYNIYSVIAHIDSMTFTTPSAGDIYAGLAVSEGNQTFYSGIAVERRSGGGTNLVTYDIDSGGPATYANRTALASTSGLWLRIEYLHSVSAGGGENIRGYYRTSAPTADDNAYTLLGTINAGASQQNDRVKMLVWESQNSDGAATMNCERFSVIPILGPG